MKSLLIFAIIIIGQTLTASEKSHKHHKSHVHGTANLSIAFDGTKGRIEFKAAAEGILGFEHEAKTEKDKAKLAETISKFETQLNLFVKFEDSLGCVYTLTKNNLEIDKKHADFVVLADVLCQKSPLNTNVVFDFSAFKALSKTELTFLIGDLQKSAVIKKKPLTVHLK